MDVACGVAHLHHPEPFTIIHHDLKSPNVLLNKTCTLSKIADVGLARVLREDDHFSKMSMRGTWTWMAPELMLGEMPIGTPCDIFSFGVVRAMESMGSLLPEVITLISCRGHAAA